VGQSLTCGTSELLSVFPRSACGELRVVWPIIFSRTVHAQPAGREHRFSFRIPCFTFNSSRPNASLYVTSLAAQLDLLPAFTSFVLYEPSEIWPNLRTWAQCGKEGSTWSRKHSDRSSLRVCLPPSSAKFGQIYEPGLSVGRRVRHGPESIQTAHPCESDLPGDLQGGDHHLQPSSAKYRNLAKFVNLASVWEGGFNMVWKAFRQIILAILTS
jgi:hypothetical protein